METTNTVLELPVEEVQIFFEEIQSDDIFKAWTCSVCGMDDWCGTEGCPGDPT